MKTCVAVCKSVHINGYQGWWRGVHQSTCWSCRKLHSRAGRASEYCLSPHTSHVSGEAWYTDNKIMLGTPSHLIQAMSVEIQNHLKLNEMNKIYACWLQGTPSHLMQAMSEDKHDLFAYLLEITTKETLLQADNVSAHAMLLSLWVPQEKESYLSKRKTIFITPRVYSSTIPHIILSFDVLYCVNFRMVRPACM